MGDRITTFYKCTKCKDGEVEEYDASSCLMFSANCNKCDYRDSRDYYEVSEYEIVLCTPEKAREIGGLVTCKNCKEEVMGSYIEGDKCLECKG